MTEASPKIVASRLAVDYVNLDTGAAHRAVENLDLAVAANEFLCVLGPSGCGKSTLLAAIAGFLKPAQGTLTMNGQPIAGPGAERGVVFQEYALLPWMTVLDNAALGLKLRGIPRKERYETARRFLAMANLHGVEHKYPHELSGGMKQRVAVARTLANAPEVMLMDEPFAAVDAQTRTQLQADLLTLWELGRKTIIFVTHDITEAIALGDRALVLSKQPTRIAAEHMIPIPRPRNVKDIFALPGFAVVYEKIRADVQ